MDTARMDTVRVHDRALEAYKELVFRAVAGLKGQGLKFGYPSQHPRNYRKSSDLQFPVHVMGPSIGRHSEELGRKLSTTFKPTDRSLKNHYVGTGRIAGFEVDIELWDTSYGSDAS